MCVCVSFQFTSSYLPALSKLSSRPVLQPCLNTSNELCFVPLNQVLLSLSEKLFLPHATGESSSIQNSVHLLVHLRSSSCTPIRRRIPGGVGRRL